MELNRGSQASNASGFDSQGSGFGDAGDTFPEDGAADQGMGGDVGDEYKATDDYDPAAYYAEKRGSNLRQRSSVNPDDSDYEQGGPANGKPQVLWCGFPRSACIVFWIATFVALAAFAAVWWFCIKNKHPETIVKTTHKVVKVLSCPLFCQWICHNWVFDLIAVLYSIILTFLLYIFCCQYWYCCCLPYNHWFVGYNMCDNCYANCCSCCDCGNGPSDPENQMGGTAVGPPATTSSGMSTSSS